MASSMLKTAALLAGAAVSLGAARRFAKRVPLRRSVAIFETIGTVPGAKKGEKLLIGFPVHATSEPVTDESTKATKKEVRAGAREADSWLKKTSKDDDGKRKANRTLGGNREAVCEFQLVKRTRAAKGRAIGVTKRCFTLGGTETTITEEEERVVIDPPSFPGVLPGMDFDPMMNGFPMGGYGPEDDE